MKQWDNEKEINRLGRMEKEIDQSIGKKKKKKSINQLGRIRKKSIN